jgi:hypothetical protein
MVYDQETMDLLIEGGKIKAAAVHSTSAILENRSGVNGAYAGIP